MQTLVLLEHPLNIGMAPPVKIQSKRSADIILRFKPVQPKADDAGAFLVQVGPVHATEVGQPLLRPPIRPDIREQQVMPTWQGIP